MLGQNNIRDIKNIKNVKNIKYVFSLLVSFALVLFAQVAFADRDESSDNQKQNACIEQLSVSALQAVPSISFLVENPELVESRLARVQNVNTVPDQTFGRTIMAEHVPEFNTIRLFNRASGRIFKGAQLRVLVLHGGGSSRSFSGSMRAILRHFSEPGQGKNGSTIQELRNYENYMPIAAEAIDLPGHGVGPDLRGFEDPDHITDWLAAYLMKMKAETPHLPLFVLTRSASGSMISTVNAKYPNLLSGLVLMSPTMPGHAELIKAGTDEVFRLAERGLFEINHHGLAWVDKFLHHVTWTPDYFGDQHMLILLGSNDGQVVAQEREYYHRLVEENHNIELLDIEGAEHDVLNVNTPMRAMGMMGYRRVFDFFKSRMPKK